MNIKDLKQKIMNLDDNMIVGGSGHFGEFLECFDASLTTVSMSKSDYNQKQIIFCISIESAGEEPD